MFPCFFSHKCIRDRGVEFEKCSALPSFLNLHPSILKPFVRMHLQNKIPPGETFQTMAIFKLNHACAKHTFGVLTFCNAPRILPSSNSLAIDFDDSIASNYSKR